MARFPGPAIGAATIGVLAGTTIFGLGATTGDGFGFLRGRACLILRPFGLAAPAEVAAAGEGAAR